MIWLAIAGGSTPCNCISNRNCTSDWISVRSPINSFLRVLEHLGSRKVLVSFKFLGYGRDLSNIYCSFFKHNRR